MNIWLVWGLGVVKITDRKCNNPQTKQVYLALSFLFFLALYVIPLMQPIMLSQSIIMLKKLPRTKCFSYKSSIW